MLSGYVGELLMVVCEIDPRCRDCSIN